jgi:hypothetical protein
MNLRKTIFPALAILAAAFNSVSAGPAFKKNDTSYEDIIIESEDGLTSDASFFKAVNTNFRKTGYIEPDRGIVFVPGVDLSKKSWYFLATHFQKKNIASITLRGKRESDVLRGINYLKDKGIRKIALIGGSLGGGTVMRMCAKYNNINVDKVVAMGLIDGAPINDSKIHKLFIVTEEDPDGSYKQTIDLYNRSSDPKTLEVYEGSAHAQQIFRSKDRKKSLKLIFSFILDKGRFKPEK